MGPPASTCSQVQLSMVTSNSLGGRNLWPVSPAFASGDSGVIFTDCCSLGADAAALSCGGGWAAAPPQAAAKTAVAAKHTKSKAKRFVVSRLELDDTFCCHCLLVDESRISLVDPSGAEQHMLVTQRKSKVRCLDRA